MCGQYSWQPAVGQYSTGQQATTFRIDGWQQTTLASKSAASCTTCASQQASNQLYQLICLHYYNVLLYQPASRLLTIPARNRASSWLVGWYSQYRQNKWLAANDTNQQAGCQLYYLCWYSQQLVAGLLASTGSTAVNRLLAISAYKQAANYIPSWNSQQPASMYDSWQPAAGQYSQQPAYWLVQLVACLLASTASSLFTGQNSQQLAYWLV